MLTIVPINAASLRPPPLGGGAGAVDPVVAELVAEGILGVAEGTAAPGLVAIVILVYSVFLLSDIGLTSLLVRQSE